MGSGEWGVGNGEFKEGTLFRDVTCNVSTFILSSTILTSLPTPHSPLPI
ncbi:MAG: hypothetical protein KME64_09225 [Scytonematopsis contorta HA4267-MV1]|nr:hypothetical protein [Scytonematopsis contorta HA4267-MV1]